MTMIELTRYTNAQINLSWDTKQTMEQYDEIREDEPFDRDEFLEYVARNFLDWLRNSTDKELLREIQVMNDEGEVLD
jgi:hypothetical protein